MQIQIIPENDPKANELICTVEKVAKRHPLIDANGDKIRKRLDKMTVFVKLGEDFEPFESETNIKSKKVILIFGRWLDEYKDIQTFEKALYHELTHVIDRLNLFFGVNCHKEQKARDLQPKAKNGFSLYMHIWNCNVDGRLEKYKLNPRNLEYRIKEFRDNEKHFDGHFALEIDKIFEHAWNSKNLTFNGVINLVQKCLQCWQPERDSG